MTYRDGFVKGVIVGTTITALATGYLRILPNPELYRSIALFLLFCVFILVQLITIARAWKQSSLFGTTGDGFLNGISFIEATVIFLLYGFKI